MVTAPVDLRTKKAESFSPQALQGFWSKMKIKNPKIVVMSPTVFTKYTNQKEVIWQQYRLCLAVAEYQVLGGKHLLILGPESGKIWWLQKVQYLQKKYNCKWTLLRGTQPKWIFHNLVTYYNRLRLYRLRVSEWFQQYGRFVQFSVIVFPSQT